VAAPSASAAWVFDPGTGDYKYLDSGGNSGAYEIPPSQFRSLLDRTIVAGDEAMGQPIPTDIPATDAQAGATLWDHLQSAGSFLKTEAMDVLGAVQKWPLFDSLPAALRTVGAGGGAFYVGWQIGSAIAGLLGISGGGSVTTQCSGCVSETPNGLLPVRPGYDVCDGRYEVIANCGTGTGQLGPVGGCGSCTAGPAEGYLTPVDGFIVQWSVTGGGYNAWNDTLTGNIPATGQAPGVPPSNPQGCFSIPITDYSVDGTGTHHPGQFAMWCSANFSSLPGPGQATSSPIATTGTSSAPSPATEDTQRSQAQTCIAGGFQNDFAGYNVPCDDWSKYMCAQPNSGCNGATTTIQTQTITLPQITHNETADDYRRRLEVAGLLGTISVSVLPDTSADVSVAPDDVVRTSPAAGTQVDPKASVTIYTNPDDVSATPVTGPVGPIAPGVSIPQAATPCSVFPFGIPCWIHDSLSGGLTATAQAPSFSVALPDGVCRSNPQCAIEGNLGNVFGVDLSSVMNVVRPILLFLSLLALGVWLAGMAMGGSTSGGGGGGGGEGGDD
jgi:hypothetical protein